MAGIISMVGIISVAVQPTALKFYLVACLLLRLVLSLIPGSKAIGNADGTGSNGSFIPTRNKQVSVPIKYYHTSVILLSPFEGLAQVLRPRM